MTKETPEPQRLQYWITEILAKNGISSLTPGLVDDPVFRSGGLFLSLHTVNSCGYNSENHSLGGSAPVLAGAIGGFACF